MSTDFTRVGKSNQKRAKRTMVIQYTEAQILSAGGALFANLPERCVITNSFNLVKTASGTATSTIQAEINGANYGSALAVTAAGVVQAQVGLYLPTGGSVVLKAGTTAPADGALEGEYVIEYIELDTVTGEYTN